MTRSSWAEFAACIDAPPDLFFPERREGRSNRGNEAKGWCARCPVVRECFTAGVELSARTGLWGGAGSPIRRRLGKLADGEPSAHPEGCRCPYHVALEEHVAALRRAYTDEGTPAHGRWEAFVHAGCRCSRCATAHRRHGGT